MTLVNDLVTITSSICSAFTAGKVPEGQAAPYAVVYGSSLMPASRTLDAKALRRETARVMAVSNNQTGAATLALRIGNSVDATVSPTDNTPLYVSHISDPYQDTSDPSEEWWTATIEVRHYQNP